MITVALAFSIPLFKPLTSLLIACLFIGVLISRKHAKKQITMPMVFLLGLYFLQCLSLFGSDEMARGISELEFKASFLVFPIIFYFSSPYTRAKTNSILKSFVFGLVVYMIISLVMAVIRWQDTGDLSELSYYKLSSSFHPSYIAFYCCLAISIVFFRISDAISLSKRGIVFTLINLLIIFYTSLLASKAGLIGMIFCLMSIILYSIVLRKKEAIKTVLYYVGLLILLLIFSFKIPLTQERINTLANAGLKENKELLDSSEENKGDQIKNNTVSIRLLAWKSSFELIKKHPFGVGGGDVTPELKKIYLRENHTKAYDKGINSHNQFLQTTVELGWLGLLTLLTFLGYSFFLALRQRNFLLVIFLCLCAFNMLLESFFEHQAGIIFIVFFILLLQHEDVKILASQKASSTD